MTSHHLFEAFGVEMEFMIVDDESLSVKPICDRVIFDVAGDFCSEVEQGELCWSNELARHVIELKTNGPAKALSNLPTLFQRHVVRLNELLRVHQACLMPTAMHPWMDPVRELELWPHDYNPVYEAFNRIFDCRGHGWANLQSVHLNLPFANDEEFGRLHAAIRLLLPLIPALAASSPVVDGKPNGVLDNRVDAYCRNSANVPSVAGKIIPEAVFTIADYHERILQPMYRAIAPLDPEGILQHEWLNARGAIARFERNTIEIRLVDTQECPAADLAVCQAIVAVAKTLVQERWTSWQEQQSFAVDSLADILVSSIRDADATIIEDDSYLRQFGWADGPIPAIRLWRHAIETADQPEGNSIPLQQILKNGTLARRILHALKDDTGRLPLVYRALCRCLADGRMFGDDR
ncbi:MAG: glutamate--cysteine ligase [Gemmatales bacterium]|nr:MAG: glutamate--cysteine ligase [Gemmatales bacterium]